MRHKVSPNASKRPTGRSESSPTQVALLARARRNVPVTISFPHLFAWWRTLRADQFRDRQVHIARHRKHIGEVAAAREHELLVRKLEEEARLAAQKAMRAAGKKPTATSAEGRKTLPANPLSEKDEPDEEFESLFARRRPPPPSHPVTPARAAARLLFARMFDLRPALREAIGSSAPVVLIDVPDPEMLERVLATWQDALFPETARVMEIGASNSGKRDDYDVLYVAVQELPKAKDKSQRNDEALSALSLALPLIAISPAAETHLPEALLKSRPIRLSFPGLDPVTIARTIRIVTGKRCGEFLEVESTAGITPVDLLIAVRFDRTPAECMAELRRLAAEKSVHKRGRDISLDELHGMDEAVAWARSTIRDLEAWRRGEIPWSALDPGACLVGPPGTGKTLFAECFARAARLPVIACPLAQWQGTDEGHLGHLLRAMKRDFDAARARAPCLLFVDEIDSFANRSKLRHAHADYVVEVVNGFIAQLDGIAGREGLIYLAASNDLSRCDPAILRSGRINRIVHVRLPDARDLERMFRVRLAGRLAGEDLEEICLLALGSTGADVERIANDALRFARHANRPLKLADLRRALVSEEDQASSEIRRAAVHEAGHLLAEIVLFGHEAALHAIVARSGERGGATVRTQAPPFAGTYSDYDRELIFLNHNGAIVRKEPNGEFAFALPPLREQKAFVRREEQRQRTATSPDDALIETYLKHRNVTGYFEREARAVWALYKQLTNGKPLKDASRDDGRKLVDYYEKQGLKSATIQKKIGWLTAAVNLAIDEATLKFNPFSSIVPERDDKQRRLPLSETDIRNVKQNLDRLDEGDQLLFRVLASTGMRLAEAFEIDGEMKERGRRYIIVGQKTSQSLRRVPLPTAVLPFLPRIEGRLFPGGPRAASKRLNRFLNNVGIGDRRKVVHSLRHRAQDRLRAAGCPEDCRWAILGHEKETVVAGYGEGFPVPMLRRWIDKIGF
jgi:cell division protease FtsH